MTRQQVENRVFLTHNPLTVDEVMKAIDEYAEEIRADERERIVRELENLNIIKGEQYEEDYELQILICSTIERAIEIVRGGENENE